MSLTPLPEPFMYPFPAGIVPRKYAEDITEADTSTYTDTSISPKVKPVVTPLPKVLTNNHSHYFKDVRHLEVIDVYRVLELFNVTDPCIQHAAKKLLVAGGRGAGKSIDKDIQEVIDSLNRWQAMKKEDSV